MADEQEKAPQDQQPEQPAEAPKNEATEQPAEAPKTEAAEPQPQADAPDPAPEAAEAPAPEATDDTPTDGGGEAGPESKPAPQLEPGKQYIWGTGRRKSAIARVRIRPGSGKFVVNKKEANDYFNHERDRQAIIGPLATAKMLTSWDVFANVSGGGYGGQAGAVVLGLARALSKAVPDVESALRDQGMLTRDARMKERKKYGQRGARRRFQFSKR